MAIVTVTGLAQALRDSRLLGPARLAELDRDVLPRFDEPRALARDLLRRGWLTAFQINQVLQGRGGELFLDHYVLLERLGEGGMGQVFKARHRRMDRLVALKLLRRDKIDSGEAVKRFYREVQAAAQLSHPNIVTAYDAGEAGGTYFFAMEYIDGPDLGKLVTKNGPLSARAACEYVRQAALGLQHAFEKGLVHRDIKPSNVLVTAGKRGARGPHAPAFGGDPAPVVKILDMGLARLNPAFLPDGGATLTQAQMILGTPDFIAPEQARSSRAADVRSDLYSLGCTFYYLLTAQVPFPCETPMEKLLKHYLEEPAPLEELRPGVPAAVGRVVRRLMAKDPDQRYQTPAELAEALTPLAGVPSPSAAAVVLAARPDAPDEPAEDDPDADPPPFETVAELSQEFDTDTSLSSASLAPKAARRPARGRYRRAVVAAVVLVLTAVLLFLLLTVGLD